MPSVLHFEQLEIGQQWTSNSRTVTEADVVNFANTTGDFNPLHLSREYAAQTPYGQRLAHGLLGLSWVMGLCSHSPLVKITAFVGIRNWDFLRPLFFGDTVHVVNEIIDKKQSGRRNGKIFWQMQLINQRGEVTQQGVIETLVAMQRPAARSRLRRPEPSSELSSVPREN